MPTKNPRLTVTFEPAFKARIERLSELSGNSQGALVAELLTGCMPAIDRIISLMEAAKKARGRLTSDLVSDLEAAQSRVEAQLGIALADADDISASLTDPIEKVQRRGAGAGGSTRERAAAGSGTPPPISNRGVRSVDNSHREIKRGHP